MGRTEHSRTPETPFRRPLAVKEQVLDFCKNENKYLYAVFSREFQQFNGRIGYQELRWLSKRFDEKSDSTNHRISQGQS